MLKQMLSSGSKISMKRVLGGVGTLLITICALTELFTELEVSANTFDSLVYLVAGCVFAIASEQFAKPNKDEEK